MQRQHASTSSAMSTSTAETTKEGLAGPSNMAVQEELGDLNVAGGEVTPCVAYGNTSASRFGNLAASYGAVAGEVYEVTFNLARLMQVGARESYVGELSKVGTLEGLGHDKDTDYIEVNGQEVVGVGAVPFVIRGGFDIGYGQEITMRVGNNGLLCLDRLARSTMELGQTFGADEDSGYTLPPGKNLEVLCAMRMGNEVKNVDARSDGFLGGVDPSDLRSRVQSMIYATLGASNADRVGLDQVTKPGVGIAETAMWANRYREYDQQQGGSFSDQAAGRLNNDIGRLFMDAPGRPPETYIFTMVDFSAEIAELFANNGTSRAKIDAHMDFLAAVRDKLKASLDLSFLDNTDPGFQQRFRQHWMDAIDEAFARTQDFSQMQKDEAWIHKDHTYTSAPRPEQQVVAQVHDNSEGLQDGTARFQMPDFSTWGMNPVVEQEGGETTDAGTAGPVSEEDAAKAEAEAQERTLAQTHAFLMAEKSRLAGWDGSSRFHLVGTPRHDKQPAQVTSVLEDLVANGGANVSGTELRNAGAYEAVIDAWLALVEAMMAGGDTTAQQAAFDAAVSAFEG